jgi:Raf kinase inhibitor-like YbhB/YbcL family protein
VLVRSLLCVYVAALIAGCSNAHPTSTSAPPSPTAQTSNGPQAFTLSSKDLSSGRWPQDATCDGGDNPPDLHWNAGPSATASYALQVFDPDAPNGGFTHWMLANEPPTLREPTPLTGVSGRNDFGKEGYNGPCPPTGATHHYVVTVYAVDSMLSLQPLYRHQDFQRALSGHILAQASITATYGR